MLPNMGAPLASGPPPQAVLDKRPWWHTLVFLLAITALLRLMTLDIVGGVLTGLMLCMAVMITSDGMQEMPRYALVFGILSALCFFFDVIPFVGSLAGRSEVTITPVKTVRKEDMTQLTYNTTVRTTPFFDREQGFVYNGTSLAMCVSPFVMLLGALLALHAHIQLERVLEPLMDEGFSPTWMPASVSGGPSSGAGQPLQGGVGNPAAANGGAYGGYGYAPGASIARFQGTARRLGCD